MHLYVIKIYKNLPCGCDPIGESAEKKGVFRPFWGDFGGFLGSKMAPNAFFLHKKHVKMEFLPVFLWIWGRFFFL
jgi:hypothetical protein